MKLCSFKNTYSNKKLELPIDQKGVIIELTR